VTSPLDRVAQASAVRPSPRQLAWQHLEFYGFIHFGINTMTDREWGLGHEDTALFNPERLDADQWVLSLVSAGMRALILTCKHHDGFCLWPSKVTAYSVKASPWRDGKGDVVAEVAAACSRHGIKFGVYLSPWDRTENSYGSGKDYDDFFVSQLHELLTGYGPVFSVWFDGANGEGPNGRKQLYDWDRYFSVIRDLQPDAVISVCGPDVRWCGNEAGHTRPDEWSVVSASLRGAERTASNSQKVDDGLFSRLVKSDEQDLGSRKAITATDDALVWYPAEVNTSIRPGWFYHANEDHEVRSPDELFDIYCGSVGGNASFLLNIPPNAEGLITDADRSALDGLGRLIRNLYQSDVASQANIRAEGGIYDPAHGLAVESGEATPRLTFTWPDAVALDGVVLEEDIAGGQQIEALTVEVETPDGQRQVASCQSVGYRRILRFEPVVSRVLSIVITGYRGPFLLKSPKILQPGG
jgi:alpha-L-fucosidase